MKYNYREGVSAKRQKKRGGKALTVASFVMFIGGGYLLVNSLWPMMPGVTEQQSAAITEILKKQQPALKENRLYVPKIGVDVAVVTGVSESTLEGGAWHRNDTQGDPAKGNNFVLAAHRFNLGLTPDQTRAKSPFYHIDRLQTGDQVFVDFSGTRYAYEVTKRYKVSDTETSIENPTAEARMTLYSCDLRGPKLGREVVEAKPIGTIAWTDSGPKLKTL